MIALSFPAFPNLVTERLVLRQLVAADVIALINLRSNEIVNKYINRPKTVTPEGALQFVDKITANISNGQSMYWVIALQEDNELIGTICLWNIDTANESMEIGYELLPSFHGKNIMQEALQPVVDFGFNILQLKNITAFTTIDNIASKKLLERNNFKVDDTKTLSLQDEEEMKGNVIYILEKY